MFGLIYKITNIQNNKVYIGRTSQSILTYINAHYRDAEKNIDHNCKYFYQAIRKYGIKD